MLLLFYMNFVWLAGFSVSDTLVFGNNSFVIDYHIQNSSSEFDKKLNFYRLDKQSQEKVFLLSHTIHSEWGDCNSESIELGTYTYQENSITFYSIWGKMGDAPVSPFGARKQVFTIATSGKVSLSYSELYIEAGNPGWPETSGVQFLYEAPKNETEQAEFESYVQRMEKEYHADFVYGAQADHLLKEVRGILCDEIESETKYWNESNSLGFKI